MKEASMICSPCGHRVICGDCAKERSQGQTAVCESHCPLCDIPVHGYTQVHEEEICVICRECPATTIIQSCGHKCVCYECAVKVSQEQKKCPHCHGRIIGIKQEFPIYESVVEQEMSLPRIEQRLDDEMHEDNVFMIRPVLRWKSARSLYNPLRSVKKPANERSQMTRRGSVLDSES
jgi:hypothetical protein